MVTLTDRKWLFVDPTKVSKEELGHDHEFSAKVGYLVYAIMAENLKKTFFLISDDSSKFVWVPVTSCRLLGCFEGPPPEENEAKSWE